VKDVARYGGAYRPEVSHLCVLVLVCLSFLNFLIGHL
jgi:hypothetical protein